MRGLNFPRIVHIDVAIRRMTTDFDNAYTFLFDETYQMWKSDLRKIFRIGTRGTRGGCNLSSCILVLIGIESFSKFFSNERDDANAVADFVDKYYPHDYHGKMKNIHKLFRHGLAHYFYPKSEISLTNTSKIAFGVNEKGRVVPLSRLRMDLDNCRKKVLKLSPRPGKPYVVVPQVLFLDTVTVMEALKKRVKSEVPLQKSLVENHKRIRKKLGHHS